MLNLTASVVQKNGDYRFRVENFDRSYSIWYSTGSPKASKRLLLENATSPSFELPSPENQRLFFHITSSSGQSVQISNQLITDVDISNFRDMGGYRSQDGRQVKWGVFYRSGLLEGLSGNDQNYLRSMGLSTIFDLRSIPEVAKRADVVPDGIEYINRSGIVTMDSPSPRQGNLDMKSLILKSQEDPEILAELDGYLHKSYATMAEHPAAFKDLFRTILRKKGEPLLFHCTAGKDRTGVSGALILTALGVPKSTIMEDYLLSNFYRKAEIEKMVEEIKEHTDNPKVIRLVRDMAEVQPNFLNNTYSAIDENYGGMEGFFKESLDLDENSINQLREEYLE